MYTYDFMSVSRLVCPFVFIHMVALKEKWHKADDNIMSACSTFLLHLVTF